jgi:3-oxoacyl-(acyl-carrier-protein) synthase
MTPPRQDFEIVASAQVHAGPQVPPLAGFFASDFAPLVYAAVRECLGDPRSGHLLEGVGDRVGIVLGSRRFDTASLELSVEQVNQGRVSPILFYQVLPTAVLGHIARGYRLTGPVNCVAVTGDPREEVLEVARLLLADESAEWVLGLTVEMDPDPAKAFASADLLRSGSGPAADGKAS